MVNVLLKAGRSVIKTRKTDQTNSIAANKARRKRKLNNNTDDGEEPISTESNLYGLDPDKRATNL